MLGQAVADRERVGRTDCRGADVLAQHGIVEMAERARGARQDRSGDRDLREGGAHHRDGRGLPERRGGGENADGTGDRDALVARLRLEIDASTDHRRQRRGRQAPAERGRGRERHRVGETALRLLEQAAFPDERRLAREDVGDRAAVDRHRGDDAAPIDGNGAGPIGRPLAEHGGDGIGGRAVPRREVEGIVHAMRADRHRHADRAVDRCAPRQIDPVGEGVRREEGESLERAVEGTGTRRGRVRRGRRGALAPGGGRRRRPRIGDGRRRSRLCRHGCGRRRGGSGRRGRRDRRSRRGGQGWGAARGGRSAGRRPVRRALRGAEILRRLPSRAGRARRRPPRPLDRLAVLRTRPAAGPLDRSGEILAVARLAAPACGRTGGAGILDLHGARLACELTGEGYAPSIIISIYIR